MIYGSKVILLPLKGIVLRVTFPEVPRYGIMAIFLATVTPSTIFLSVELLPIKSNPVDVLPSFSMCFVSQLEMFQHLIPKIDLERSIFEEIVSYRVSLC